MLALVGIFISRQLEERKSAISKEKEWQSKWADKFLEVANKYNDKVTEYIVEFSLIAQASEEQLEGW